MEEKLKEIFNSLEFKKQENCPEESILFFMLKEDSVRQKKLW